MDTCQVQVLLFADDTVLVAENEDFKHNIKALQEAIRMHKLAINWGKRNIMVISKKPTECNIEIEKHTVSINQLINQLNKRSIPHVGGCPGYKLLTELP